MATSTVGIPYVKQSETPAERSCGAACLSMVYGSLGLKVSKEEIWTKIAKRNAFGSVSSTTHLMAKDAIDRGFDAVIIQASHPLQVLRVCQEKGIRVILNHRVDSESPAGHYSVLADIDKSDIILHDPVKGPMRRLNFATLLDIWRAGMPISETIGNVLIGIAPRSENVEAELCGTCKLALPAEVACPKCHHPVALRPSTVMGCVAESCGGRMWSYLCCPECDCTWKFHRKAEEKDTAQKADAAPKIDPLDVDQLYKELDKFINHIVSVPAAAAHEDVKKQVEFIYAQKEPLRMALAESAANRRLRMDQLNVMAETARMNRALHQKRAEEAARQAPPLDGDELGMALLRNLGFVR